LTQFDQDYYKRYYYDPRTAVITPKEMQARASLIANYTEHIGLPVRRILDAGCGTGMLRPRLLKLLPRASYTGLEVSEYMCRRHGWEHGRVQDYRPGIVFDLVICYDVVQYLDDPTATRALNNLARLCRGVLYFTALTKLDWKQNCDRKRTDCDVFMRTAEWYRTRLRRKFHEIGAGFWVRRGAPVTLWELESATRA
jgi:SAM-dependent methyltransferase